MTDLPARKGGLDDILLPLAAAVGIGCGVTVLVLTLFNYFLGPISVGLALSKPQTAAALSIFLAVLIVALPIAGMIADRVGPRRTILVSTALFAASLYAASLSQNALQLYLAFGAAGALGAGASPIAYNRAIVSRFVKNRGLALGIALSGGGAAGMILPRFMRPLIIEHGWRQGLVVMALLALAAGLIGALFCKDEPATAAPAGGADGFDLRDAVRTRPFLIMCIAFAFLGAVLAAVTSHLTQIWEFFRLDPAQVPNFQLVMGGSTILGRLIGGWLMDRMPAKWVGAGAAIAGAVGFVLLAYGHASQLAVLLAAVCIGSCTGSESDVVSYLTGRYFGLKRFARIYGVFASTFMAGAAVGPIGMSLAAQTLPFEPLLLTCAGLLAFSALLLTALRPPAARDSTAPSARLVVEA